MRPCELVSEDVEPYQGLDMSLEVEKDDDYVDDDDVYNQSILVRATAGGRELGHVLFTLDYDSQGLVLNPQDLEVDERYRGQGIARTMYDYVKSRGYRIRRSGQQTDAGAGFWNRHRPEQNIWEQEIDEVKILSRVKGKGADPSQLPNRGQPISPKKINQLLGRYVTDIDDRHSIYRDQFGGQITYNLFNRDTDRSTLTAFGSRYPGNPDSFIVSGLYASPDNDVAAAEFYRRLIIDLGLTLVSDRKQSPGGQRVWQRLEQLPGIEVHGFDTATGEVLNIGAADEEMYSISAADVRGSEAQKIARDIRLVATAR
jgi:GNAT superfamily N-acetyltransferase